MEREGTMESGPELVKGEDGCAFAACRNSMLINFFPESHAFIFLNFQTSG